MQGTCKLSLHCVAGSACPEEEELPQQAAPDKASTT